MALFLYLLLTVKNVSHSDLSTLMKDALGGERKKEFLTYLSSLCTSMVEIVNDTNEYTVREQSVRLLTEACVRCVSMMLNFSDKEGTYFIVPPLS